MPGAWIGAWVDLRRGGKREMASKSAWTPGQNFWLSRGWCGGIVHVAVRRGPVKRFHPSTTLDVVATVMARVLPSIGCGGWKNCGVGHPSRLKK